MYGQDEGRPAKCIQTSEAAQKNPKRQLLRDQNTMLYQAQANVISECSMELDPELNYTQRKWILRVLIPVNGKCMV